MTDFVGDGAHGLRRPADDGLVVVGEVLAGDDTGRQEEVEVEVLHLLGVADDRVALARREGDLGLQVLLLLELPMASGPSGCIPGGSFLAASRMPLASGSLPAAPFCFSVALGAAVAAL